LGFHPAREINQELLELEPEDIHMTMELQESSDPTHDRRAESASAEF